ncbi:eCIS core domain-containing protein [Paractinoplanes durhamensis]|uniref:eCIS core domain-containing protein n=1 Tax=Paractinoplanes durhamensis TaxID=113563 RepID=A0ABQ3Z774_9ACTN|nr:DUF4157 domain-containing protein [Actinoplanes durhamensis]GIE05681.1 hypothetical protein Adu01nite_70310 [Actinoplanes durhamensis]
MRTFAQKPNSAERTTSGNSAMPGRVHSGVLRRSIGNQAAQRIEAPPIVDEVAAEPGRALDPPVRSLMETRFGHDFGHVRIHTGGRAAEAARSVNAKAYTVGSDVVFADQAFKPEAESGQRLIAHELTHVLQQSGGDAGVVPDAADEFGDASARHADQALSPRTSSPRRVQRQGTCDCCVSSVGIKNIAKIDNATHMGHSFDLEIKMARAAGPKPGPECTLEWWEKTNVPAIPGMNPNTWTEMFQLYPQSPTFAPWHNRSTACGGTSTVTINDPPGLGKRPGRTVTRTLEFDLRVKSGPGATCANPVKGATAKQVLTMVNGAPDWAKSSFA